MTESTIPEPSPAEEQDALDKLWDKLVADGIVAADIQRPRVYSDVNRWFGEPWPSAERRSDVCGDDRFRIPVPVGKSCYLCDEPIVETDRGQEMYGIGAEGKTEGPMYHHIECIARNVLGCFDLVSTGKHWTPEHVCSDSGSYRADALRVWAWIQTHPLG